VLDCAPCAATPVERYPPRHPLTLLSLPRDEVERLSPVLEIGVLRAILTTVQMRPHRSRRHAALQHGATPIPLRPYRRQ